MGVRKDLASLPVPAALRTLADCSSSVSGTTRLSAYPLTVGELLSASPAKLNEPLLLVVKPDPVSCSRHRKRAYGFVIFCALLLTLLLVTKASLESSQETGSVGGQVKHAGKSSSDERLRPDRDVASSFSMDEAPFELPSLQFVHSDSSLTAHWLFGKAMGKRFAPQIKERFREWPELQNTWLPALLTESGRDVYDTFLLMHQSAYPKYVKELEGIAAGAEVPFETVLIANVAQEFGNQLNWINAAFPKQQAEDHCSDYMLCSATRCVSAHNEDDSMKNANNTFVVDAQFGDTRFKAFVYMGDLPTGAFGVNSHAVGFSVNWVGPPPAKHPGLGRGFVTRSLLDARNPSEARRFFTREGQCGGHNMQLFDFCERSITNIEVAHERYAVTPIEETPFFHSNHYRNLHVDDQVASNNSMHRVGKVSALPAPSSLEDILAVLGDQSDRVYPLYHDKVSHAFKEATDWPDWTLATAAFDLDNLTVSIMQGNPRNGVVREAWPLSDLITPGTCEARALPKTTRRTDLLNDNDRTRPTPSGARVSM